MLKFNENIFTKKFRGENQKDAYLKACKWLAVNVVSKDELNRNVTYNISKFEDETQLPSVELKIQVVIEESIAKERHCEICKETHKSFFINEQFNCNECKLNSYHKRCENLINEKKLHIKELLKKSLEGYE